MKSITIDEILNFNPCEKYTREVLESIFDGRKSMNLFDIACEMDVPEKDRLWLLIRMVPATVLHTFVCDCAERIMSYELGIGIKPDERSYEAIKMKRLWIDGHVTDDQLYEAYSAASSCCVSEKTNSSYIAAYASMSGAIHAASFVSQMNNHPALHNMMIDLLRFTIKHGI